MRPKRIVASLLAIILMLSLIAVNPGRVHAAIAGDTYGGNIVWELSDDGVLTISGTGDIPNANTPPWYDYRSQIRSVVIEEGVTSICESAFISCSNLTKVSISNTVTTIGSFAFVNCTGLQEIDIPDFVTTLENGAFFGCSKLANVKLSQNLKTIANYAFNNCTSLKTIQIPEGVTSIGTAFIGCSSLTGITIPDSVTSIVINYGGCSNLSSLVIPDGVNAISVEGFYSCEKLAYVVIPNSVTTIGDSAFENCNKLSHVLYKGTEAQWKRITIGTNNSALSNATIHFNAAGDEIVLQPGKTCKNTDSAYCTICMKTLSLTTASGPHSYQNGKCVYCNAKEPPRLPAYAVTDTQARTGGTAEVYISVENNPGIISLRGSVTYDTSAMELIAVDNLALLNGFTAPPASASSPLILRWADALAKENNKANGNLAKLTFLINEDAEPGSYTVSIDHLEARDLLGNKIAFLQAEGQIQVVDYIPGDVDGDGEITDWDSILLNRYLAGWTVEIFPEAADADCDGEISDWDAIILEQYLAGWNVTLG